MKKMNNKGFTLIEMLVVIAIIAVLVAIIVPTVANSTMKAKGAADAANIRSLTAQAAIDMMDKGAADNTPFTSKALGASGEIEWIDNGDEVVAKIMIDNKEYNLQSFMTTAEDGSTPAVVKPAGQCG